MNRTTMQLDGVRERLGAAGASPGATESLGALLVRCAGSLPVAGDIQSSMAFVVPGRIEVLGKHTDYGGGRSLLAAADRGFALMAVPRKDSWITVRDVVSGEAIRFALDPELQPDRGWANYPMTVARRVARNFPTARSGADIVFGSDLPPAAGMSSSSALMISVFQALAAVNQLERSPLYREMLSGDEALAEYLAVVENGRDFGPLHGDHGVGTQGGSQDHTAILCSRPGHLVQYAFAPVRFESAVPLPDGYRFAVAASGVRAEKTGAARERYNRAAEQTKLAVRLWQTHTGRTEATLGAVLKSAPGAAKQLRDILRAHCPPAYDAAALVDRVDQFIEESETIIPAASQALAGRDLSAFGELVDRSQHLAEEALGNQVEETIHLARSARGLGAVAASAFGAGFGGSVWALVEDARADEFLRSWREGYRSRFPECAREAAFFTTGAGMPASRLW